MRLLILYGSQTGTAQDVAEQIWRISKEFAFRGPVTAMDDYDISHLIMEQLAIFVVATTGQGEEPDNMTNFWKVLLRKNLPTNSLQNLRFACLGLGDSSYANYNFAAKKLNKRLIQLSAIPIIPLGLCDDQHDHGIAATLLPWLHNLWVKLEEMYPHLTRLSLSKPCYKWHVKRSKKSSCANIDNLLWPLKEKPFTFKIVENTRKTSHDHFQDVRLIKMVFPAEASWGPGDILVIRPWNSDENVKELFDILQEHNLGFNRNTVVEFEEIHEDMHLPLPYQQPVTLELIAKYVWDLSAVPQQSIFSLLACNCEDELEKEKLIEFTTAEGLDELITYVNRPRRSILEVLYDFRHATAALTLNMLFEIFPIIRPRSYSIASIPQTGTLDLLVAVVDYKTYLTKRRRGICTSWLKSLDDGAEVFGTIKKGTLSIPKDISIPLIMVGPGTGIAPFRSVLLQHEGQGAKTRDLVVFFGCRYRRKDFFCGEDFKRLKKNHVAECFTAFSRDQDRKVYVQHLIKENTLYLRELILKKNAVILVAGSSNNMPKSVKGAFIDVLGDEAYVEKMIKSKRYQEETWT